MTALLSDAEARAERRRTRTREQWWQELAQSAWQRGRDAADPADALRWLDRAHRLLPKDGMLAAALAGARLQAGQAAEAAELFAELARRFGLQDAWTGLATARLLLGQAEAAADAAAAALRAGVPTPTLGTVAAAVAARIGHPGWCGLDGDGVVRAGPGRPSRIVLDGVAVRSRLPPGWRQAHQLHVGAKAGPFLGSPLPVRAIAAVEGFVEAVGGGLRGWAWYPGDPDRAPLVLIQPVRGIAAGLRAEHPAEHVRLDRPLARPRSFAFESATLADGPVSVTVDGHHLFGSPLDPGLEARAARDPVHAGFGPVWTDLAPIPPAPGAPARDPAVVIPVYRGRAETLACLHAVLATVPPGTPVHVVDDAAPEPELAAELDRVAAAGRIVLHRHAANRGFPASANTGIRAAAGHDVVLLNSDTLVPPGWLHRLRAAAYAAPGIGTATPLSNDATIVSYPDPEGGNPVPDAAEVVRLDALARRASPGGIAEVPVGVGFCLYLRRDCLDQVGLLREDLFAQGYGEENDLCLRARHHGWRHVAALDVFVGHVGGRSFGSARSFLSRRNGTILNRLHPGYDATVAAHVEADSLHAARRRMDALRWAEARAGAAALLVTHAGGGGIDRVVADRVAALRAEGLRPVVLRPVPGGCRVECPGGDPMPNLRFALPAELPELAGLLRADRVRHIELHHLLGHHGAVLELHRMLGVPLDAFVHDYASFCPRIALVSTQRRYCGEPDVAGCEACIADLGGLLEEDVAVPTLLARSAAVFAAARSVVAPSQDAATRMARHFPGLRPRIQPWEDDAAWPPMPAAPPGGVRRVCVVGAIGVEKGYEVLLACARDARRRGLPIEFTVCGFTMDDERLMAAGPVFVTGEYREDEAVRLIRRQQAHLALIPSVWPETWCFALSRAWDAGLPAAVFDLGAPAERVRRTGRGWVLPFGLQAPALNDALLALAPSSLPSQCPPPV